MKETCCVAGVRPVTVILAKAIILPPFLIGVLMAGSVSAQVDTTPPVLLDFKISPTLFDTSQDDVQITVCVMAADTGTGVSGVEVIAEDSLTLVTHGRLILSFDGATAPTECCGTLIIPMDSPQRVYRIILSLWDEVLNLQRYDHADLCAAGFVCTIENAVLSTLPDADADGVPDKVDNCPQTANPEQTDQDGDGFGDVCDLFPDDSDNEQAQCEADLAQCLANVVPDQDKDGEADTTDACPNTPVGAAVDEAGCSLAQFCAAIDATTKIGNQICKNNDWRNDEPLAIPNKGDCKVKKGNPGRADDLCVPRL